MNSLDFRVDDPRLPHCRTMLEAHLAEMARYSPPESIHALDVEGLCKSNVTFWTGWADERAVACGALLEIDSSHGEIKSMRADERFRGAGYGQLMLQHVMTEARTRGLRRLSLETGSQPEFEPARRLYEKYGFTETGPFGNYRVDPNSVFMTREITA